MSPLLLAEVIHPADVPVGNFSGELQFIAESINSAGVRCRLHVDEL
ncbi:hypothetical protein ES703_83471 [subsurface metagenome]